MRNFGAEYEHLLRSMAKGPPEGLLSPMPKQLPSRLTKGKTYRLHGGHALYIGKEEPQNIQLLNRSGELVATEQDEGLVTLANWLDACCCSIANPPALDGESPAIHDFEEEINKTLENRWDSGYFLDQDDRDEKEAEEEAPNEALENPRDTEVPHVEIVEAVVDEMSLPRRDENGLTQVILRSGYEILYEPQFHRLWLSNPNGERVVSGNNLGLWHLLGVVLYIHSLGGFLAAAKDAWDRVKRCRRGEHVYCCAPPGTPTWLCRNFERGDRLTVVRVIETRARQILKARTANRLWELSTTDILQHYLYDSPPT